MILGGGETDREMHFAPLFLAVFRVIMAGKCTARGRLLLIYIIVKCLSYSVFLVFALVFARFFVCVAHLYVLTWMCVLSVWFYCESCVFVQLRINFLYE